MPGQVKRGIQMISIKTLRSRGRLSIASMAMLLLLGPVLTMSAVAQDPSGDDVAQRPLPQVEDGFVFLDGEWLEPPFEISVEATQLYLNGMPMKPWPGLRDLGDEARLRAESPETANELAVIAAIHLEQLGGSALDPVPAEVVDRITSLIESFPATAGVRVEGGRFFVADRQGVEAAMSLAPIPGESPAERAAALHEEAAGWTQTLEAGGVLFLLPGMSLEISAGETPTVLGDVVAALNGPGDATAHFEAILDARPIAEAVASAGGPGATFLERLAERQAQARQTAPDSSGVLKSLLPPEADDGDIAYGGKHRWSETPSSNRAYIFTPAAGSPLQRVRFIDSPTCQPEPIKKAARLHGYRVIDYGYSESTLDNFMGASGRAGILYLCAHGGGSDQEPWIAIEQHFWKGDAYDAMVKHQTAGIKGIVAASGCDPDC